MFAFVCIPFLFANGIYMKLVIANVRSVKLIKRNTVQPRRTMRDVQAKSLWCLPLWWSAKYGMLGTAPRRRNRGICQHATFKSAEMECTNPSSLWSVFTAIKTSFNRCLIVRMRSGSSPMMTLKRDYVLFAILCLVKERGEDGIFSAKHLQPFFSNAHFKLYWNLCKLDANPQRRLHYVDSN